MSGQWFTDIMDRMGASIRPVRPVKQVRQASAPKPEAVITAADGQYYSLFNGRLTQRAIARDSKWGGSPIVYRAPRDERVKMLQAIGNWQQGRNSAEAGYCSLAFQRAIAAAGVKGAEAGGMGHAKNMGSALKSIGFQQVTDGSIRPGDAIIYLKGGGGYGHIGISTGTGMTSPMRSRRSESVRVDPRSKFRLEMSSNDPTKVIDRFDVQRIQRGLTLNDAWASTPTIPDFTDEERSMLVQMSDYLGIPEIKDVLKYLED